SPAAATFRTREMNPALVRPTAVASIRPGAPCAFMDGGVRQCSPESPSLAPLTLASDLPVEAHFTRPVDATSLRLGQTVEVLDLDGGAAVAGRLATGADWLQFIPDEPWREGHPYALRLGGAGDAGCGRSAICDVGGRAVNTD